MNRNKIAIAVALTFGLLALIALIGMGLVIFFVNDVLYWSDGILSLLAFVVAAFIIGYAINKVVDGIKRVWE